MPRELDQDPAVTLGLTGITLVGIAVPGLLAVSAIRGPLSWLEVVQVVVVAAAINAGLSYVASRWGGVRPWACAIISCGPLLVATLVCLQPATTKPALLATFLGLGLMGGASGLTAVIGGRAWDRCSWELDGKCGACGYNLAGLDSAAPCPECGGTRRPPER